MQGTLARYGPRTSHLAFISPASSLTGSGSPIRFTSPHVVLVGGLTEGFMFASYVGPLTEALTSAGWHVVQAQMSSSYTGFGCGSLDRDADELLLLCRWLVDQRQASALLLMGHSTGCQDLVRLMQKAKAQGLLQGAAMPGGAVSNAAQQLPILGTILQAAVSDAEYLQDPSSFPQLPEVAERARQMVAEGRAEDIVYRFEDMMSGTPITAGRFLALYEHGGDDDMFSFALSDAQLQDILAPVGAQPCLLLASGSDECVPPALHPDIPRQAARLGTAISTGGHTAQVQVVPGAPHNLEGHESNLVEHVMSFVGALA